MKLQRYTSPEQVVASLKARSYAIGVVDPKDYHAWKKKLGTPCVSKSSLVEFSANNYVHHWKEENGVKEETEALQRGSLIDCLALTPELYAKQYTCEKVDRRTNAGKARAAEIEAHGLTVLTPSEYDSAKGAADAASDALSSMFGETRSLEQIQEPSPIPSDFMPPDDGYLTQVAMWVRVDSVNEQPLSVPLIVCGMLDVLPLGEDTPLIDLKSTSTDISSPYLLNKHMYEYSYGVQAALYSDLFAACTGVERDFKFLFVSTKAPHQTRVVGMDYGTLCFYRARYQRMLQDYAFCEATGQWGWRKLPEMTYSMPAWEARKGVEV